MSASLKTYRVYCYDPVKRELVADLVEAADDEQAIMLVAAAGLGTKCEIWDGNRLVTPRGDAASEALDGNFPAGLFLGEEGAAFGAA
jgi:hypothetical protein